MGIHAVALSSKKVGELWTAQQNFDKSVIRWEYICIYVQLSRFPPLLKSLHGVFFQKD